MFENCPGRPCCSTFKGDYQDQTYFFSSLNIPFQIFQGDLSGWRTRSKLAVRGTSEQPLIGLFYEGTHDVYEIPNCRAHHPKINEAVQLIKAWIKTCQITPYDEKKRGGQLRYIQLVVERETGKIQASFVMTTEENFELKLKRLLEMAPKNFFHSLWINYNPAEQNSIFSQNWKQLFGPTFLQEEISSVPVCYLPGSFGQANPGLFEVLITNLKSLIPKGQRIGEFYAGVGVIGIALAKNASSVVLTEVNPDSKRCFDEMVKSLDPSISKKLTYRLENASSALELFDEVDVIVVDPPRKGLDQAFLKALTCIKTPKTLAYISCGFPSLKKDLKALIESQWTISHASGYTLFPGTPHLETLVVLTRPIFNH